MRENEKIIKKKINEINELSNNYSTELINAVINIEDRRFRIHYGHDIFSVLRAIINNLLKKRIQGASTIEQQLIRMLLQKREITFMRKIFEILLSTFIVKNYKKEEIINAYLNYYVFTYNVVGVKALCLRENYCLEKLSIKDSYEIAARFKYPIITRNNYVKYLKRVRTIEIFANFMFNESDFPYSKTMEGERGVI